MLSRLLVRQGRFDRSAKTAARPEERFAREERLRFALVEEWCARRSGVGNMGMTLWTEGACSVARSVDTLEQQESPSL